MRKMGEPVRRDATARGPAATAGLGAALASLLLVALTATPASAFQAVPTAERQAGLDDPRWSAFVGCWEPLGAQEEGADAGLLCVAPAGQGVEMFTMVDGEVRTSDFLIGDGQPRPIQAEGCVGEESVSFSDDGRRAFTHSAYTCDGIAQTGSGVLAHIASNQWIDVRAIEVDGERTSWVQRYRLVGPDRAAAEGIENPGFGMETAARTARFVAHRGVGFMEVEEAAREVDAEAVEGWIANRPEGFAPTAEDLEGLADAGVPESVIDVVVAKSFPERFAVNPEGPTERVAERDDPRAYRGHTGYYRGRIPMSFRMLGYGFGYVPAYGYGGYGYSGYPGYWGYRPSTVIIERREPEPRGRIVRGQGYVRPGSGDSGRSAQPRVAPSGPDRSSGASPAPARRGDSAQPSRSDRPTRTAKPRRPGGGGGGF
jgi:hypothetical protein